MSLHTVARIRPSRWWSWLGCCLAVGPAAAQTEPALSEQGFFDPLPVVLTVSRLAQPLNEVPGAVTVLDRDTIRLSGARDVADVLRLVPGYMVGGQNGASPSAAYHAPVDPYGVRNLVMIDGRSVHSPYYLGGTNIGMMGVLLEDIERIEVLRGANSAAYGANALLGVINIVTRHAADTQGTEVGLTVGGAAVRDGYARLGWSSGAAQFRLSAGERSDSGYANAFDDLRLRQVHFRSDWRPNAGDDVLLEMGAVERQAGAGYAPKIDDPTRNTQTSSAYLLGQWQRQLSDDEQVKVTGYISNESYVDRYLIVGDTGLFLAQPPGVLVDFSGVGRRLNLELQYQNRLAEGWRAVWGAGVKRDEVRSAAMYSRPDTLSLEEQRLFGNMEWRYLPAALLNFSFFVGKHSRVGQYAAPRLMTNIEISPGHSLRVGLSKGVRPPGQFELDANMKVSYMGLAIPAYFSSGQVGSEVIESQELGYFFRSKEWRMSLDVRAFTERIQDMVKIEGNLPKKFKNGLGFDSKGLEYQLRWQPWADTELWFNQSLQRLAWDDPSLYQHQPPRLSSTLGWFQRLPGKANLTLLWHAQSRMTWFKEDNQIPPTRRVDLRLAYPFRWGDTRAEAALTLQAVNGDQPTPYPSRDYQFQRRALATVRMAF